MATPLIFDVSGSYIKSLMREHLGRVGLGVALCGGGVFLAVAVHYALLPGVIVTGVGIWYAHRHWTLYKKASIGLVTERRVQQVLNASPSSVVLHGALLGAGGDADHVVLGPSAVVVETKTGSGTVRYANRVLVAGARAIPKDPIAQVGRQVGALSRLTGRTAQGVVCVADMTNKPFATNGVWVCSLRDLPSVLARLPRSLTQAQAENLGKQIARAQGQLAVQKARY